MERSSKKINYFILIVFALSLLYLLIGANYGINIYDEAIGIFGALRTATGDTPYKNFWTMYAPGNYYFLAGLMSVLGWNIITERIISVIIMLLISICIYYISKRISSKGLAIIPFLVTVIWFGYCPLYARAVAPALLLSLVSLLFFLQYINSIKNKYMLYSGITAGLTLIFRHDLGAYLILSELIVLILFLLNKSTIKSTEDILKDSSEKLKPRKLYYSLFYIIGILIIFMPVSIYFISNVPSSDLNAQLLTAPLKVFPKYRSLPFPIPFTFESFTGEILNVMNKINLLWESLAFYFSLIIYVISSILLIHRFAVKHEHSSVDIWYKIIITLVGIFFYNQALIRSDIEHLFPSFIISLTLFISFFKEISYRKILTFVLIITSVFLISIPIAKKVRTIKKTYLASGFMDLQLNRANGIKADAAWSEDYIATIQYIRLNTNIKDKIFVGNITHDRIILNDVMFYFLSGRSSATKYHELHPGIVTTAEVQKQIIEELKKQHVHYIILKDFGNIAEPNLSNISSGISLLDEYIHENYFQVCKNGAYSILKKIGEEN